MEVDDVDSVNREEIDESDGSVFDPNVEIHEDEDEESGTPLGVEEIEELEELEDVATNVVATTYVWEDFSSDLEAMPKPWPTVELVNLDRRLPVKFKRYEYEPLENGSIVNISNCFDDYSNVLNESFQKTVPDWTEQDEEILLPYILHYGPNSRDMYLHMKNLAGLLYNSDSSRYLTLYDLRKLSPDTPLLFLVCLHQLLVKQKIINHTDPSKIIQSDISEPLLNYPLFCYNGIYSCFSCRTDCSKARYEHRKCIHVICSSCFDVGKYPKEFSSEDFTFQESWFRVTEKIDSQTEWQPEQVLQLLEGIERYGFEWEKVSTLVQKSKEECIMQFSTWTIGTPNILEADTLKKLLGNTSNPVMRLIHLLSNAVHPGIGSEAAKECLSLIKSPGLTADANWKAAQAGFDGAIRKAREIIRHENGQILKYVKELEETQLMILEKKSQCVRVIIGNFS